MSVHTDKTVDIPGALKQIKLRDELMPSTNTVWAMNGERPALRIKIWEVG